MNQKNNDLQQEVRIAISSLYQRADYLSTLVIVEGETDQRFLQKVLSGNISCIPVKQVLEKVEQSQNKNVIIQVINLLNDIKTLQRFTDQEKKKIKTIVEKCSVYGLIDKDFDSECDYSNLPNLFLTDTHDLETLIISTDKTLFQRLDECKIPNEDIIKAIFLAYQLGMLKMTMMDYKWFFNREHYEYILSEKLSDFIVPGYRILLIKLLRVSFDTLPNYQSIMQRIISDNKTNKFINEEGIWNFSIEKFDINTVSNLWDIINGHDFLFCLRFINKNVAQKFKLSFRLDRTFELTLIKKYNKDNFRKTKLSSHLADRKLL